MQFLLERLANAEASRDPLAAPVDMREAIQAQIQRIVACRPWESNASAMLYDFGMPSVVDLAIGGGDGLERYVARLARLISEHEPRLRQVSVSLVDAQGEGARLSRHLLVQAILSDAPDQGAFRMELRDI